MTQFIAVKFRADDERAYTYHNTGEPVAVGEEVKVATPEGWKRVVVVDAAAPKPAFATRPIGGKVDPADPGEAAATDQNPRAVIGGNRPPPFRPDVVEALDRKVREYADAGGAFLDLKVIEDEETARRATELMRQAQAVRKEIEEAAEVDKKPHYAAWKAVVAKYGELTKPIDLLLAQLKPMLSGHAERKRQAEEQRLAAERERARAEAEEAARAAAAAAARNDVIGEAEAARRAEQAAKDAARLERTQPKGQIETLTGGGRKAALRTSREAKITNRRLAFLWLEKVGYGAELDETLTQLANAALRHKRGTPGPHDGIEVTEKRTIA